MQWLKFTLKRILLWALTILAGITIVFFLQRLAPGDPIENMVMRITSEQFMTPEEIDVFRENLRARYGLTGSLGQQYINTVKRLIQFDFGVSLQSYPTKVSSIIAHYLPYTIWLLLMTTVLSWVIGNAFGLLAGFKQDKWYSKVLETLSMCVYPMPYFLVALIILVLLAYVWPVFPLVPSFGNFSLTADWFVNAFKNAFMPALSLVLVGTGWWIISMKSLSSDVAEEEFVNYARLKGLSEGSIGYRYVFRNCILAQVTGLAMRIGGIFGGSMMCEIVFSYPGVGRLVRQAIDTTDYNLLLGLVYVSTVATATAALVIDLLYPFLDPRIRHA